MTTGELREIIANVLKNLEAGHSQRAACIMAGVRVRDLNAWQARDDMGDPEFRGLRAKVEQASVRTLVKLEKAYLEACAGSPARIDEETGLELAATPPDLKAIQWYLGKRHWRDYDQQAVVAHEQLRIAREANLSALKDEQLQAKMIAMVMASPELRAKMATALNAAEETDNGVRREEDDSAAGD